MTNDKNTISVKIMDSLYKIKCPPEKISDLKESSLYLENKMREIYESTKIASIDRIVVIAAINIAHELLNQQKQKDNYIDAMNQRIQELHDKIENATDQK